MGQVLESGQGREGMQRGGKGRWLSQQTLYSPHSGVILPASQIRLYTCLTLRPQAGRS